MHTHHIIGLLLISLIPAWGFADQTGTLESLSGKRVKEDIRFTTDETADNPKDFYLRYRIDGQGHQKKLGATRSFLATDDVFLAFADFNPLKYRITAKAEEFDDPAYLAIKHLLETGKKFTSLREENEDKREELKKMFEARKDLESESSPEVKTVVDQCGTPLITLRNALETIASNLPGEADTPAAFMKTWQSKATALSGVEEVRNAITEQVSNYDTRLKEIEVATQKIADAAHDSLAKSSALKEEVALIELNGLRDQVHKTCQDQLAQATALSFTVSIDYRDGVDALTATKSAFQKLDKALEPFAKRGRWLDGVNGDKTDLIFYEYVASDEKGVELDLKVAGLKLDTTAGTFDEDWSTEATLRLRRFQRVVPEIGAGFFYTPLEIPKYGTEEVDGETVVADAGTERLDGGAAVFLDLVWRWESSTLVYPTLQLGLGTGAESPSLAAGLGLRFTKLGGLAITGGWVVSWYKDLDTLKIGDPVSGTADIEKDLKSTDGSDWYVAILYTWKIGDK